MNLTAALDIARELLAAMLELSAALDRNTEALRPVINSQHLEEKSPDA